MQFHTSTRSSSNRKSHFVLAAFIVQSLTIHAPFARAEDVPEIQPVAVERFVPATTGETAGATLELRGEATIPDGEIKLRQVGRWTNADSKIFAPMADLTIARFQGNSPFQSVSLDEVRQTLRDAGVNLGTIRFAGTMTCTVSRSDVKFDESAALRQWIDARQGRAPALVPSGTHTAELSSAAPAPTSAPAAAAGVDMRRTAQVDPAVKTLRDLILADAAVRLKLPPDSLQLTFNPADEKLLNLSEPQFKFNLEARRVYSLGDVAWDVLIVMDSGNKQVPIQAMARAWQKHVELIRPIAYRQVIQADDLVEKRVLTDRIADEPLLSIAQAVGQQSSRELKPGTVMTAPMVSPVELAKPGQFISVTLNSGTFRLKTVARAMEAGCFGQTIKVKNEVTGETFQVILSGPQQGTINTIPTSTASIGGGM